MMDDGSFSFGASKSVPQQSHSRMAPGPTLSRPDLFFNDHQFRSIMHTDFNKHKGVVPLPRPPVQYGTHPRPRRVRSPDRERCPSPALWPSGLPEPRGERARGGKEEGCKKKGHVYARAYMPTYYILGFSPSTLR